MKTSVEDTDTETSIFLDLNASLKNRTHFYHEFSITKTRTDTLRFNINSQA